MESEQETTFRCEYCERKLENYQQWSQHLLQQHNITLIECEYCNAELPSESELKLHIKTKHMNGQKRHFGCSHCPSIFVRLRSLVEHLKIKHKGSHPFICRKCNKKYKTYYSLQYHLKMAHRPLSYIRCDQCSKMFCTKETLKRHKESNCNNLESVQRAQCSMCPASYKHRSDLYRHIRKKHFQPDPILHEEDSGRSMCELNNKCNICFITFPDEETLLSHRQVFHDEHTDIFNCEDCEALFKIREAYEDHLLEEHGKHPEEHFDIDRKDLLFQEHVDFESSMVQNPELRQLMVIRKQRKFNQKIVIINYREEYDENAWTIEHDSLNESELNEINQNVKTYFENLVSHYRIDQMTEVRDLPIQICHNEPDNEEVNSGKNYLYLGTPYEQEKYFENDEEIDELNVISVNDSLGSTFDFVDEKPQNVNNSFMHCMPKMMFNCLECTNLFPDEDSLLNHLRTDHNKFIKIPVLKDIQENDLTVTTETTKSRPQDETIIEDEHPKRKDAQYLTKEKNKMFKERTHSRKMALKTKRVSASTKKLAERSFIIKSRDKSLNRGEKSNSKGSKRTKKETTIKNPANTWKNFKINKCNICHKSFKLKANLIQHMNFTHSKKKPKRKHIKVNEKERFEDIEENNKTETKSCSTAQIELNSINKNLLNFTTAEKFEDMDEDIMNYTHKNKNYKRKHAKVNLKEALEDDEKNGNTEIQSSSATSDIFDEDIMNFTNKNKKRKRKNAKVNIKEKFEENQGNGKTETRSSSTSQILLNSKSSIVLNSTPADKLGDMDKGIISYSHKKKNPKRKHAKVDLIAAFEDDEENSKTEIRSTSTAADIFDDNDEDVMTYTHKYKKLTRKNDKANIKEKFENVEENGKNESRSSSTTRTLNCTSTTADIFEEIDDDITLMFPCEHCQGLFPCIELLLNHCAWQHNYRSATRY